jgi:hypothetical protein
VATVTGLTADRMAAIEAASVVDGYIDGSGNLILVQHDGTEINAGSTLVAVPSASTTVAGKVELATDAETTTGTDATRAVTPAGLSAAVGTLVPDASTTVKGKVELATTTEATTGTDTVRAVTPAGLKAAIDAVMQLIFPVGSIYTSYSVSTNPATLLGFGTWVAITGRLLIGQDGSTYLAGANGGAETHTISSTNLPPHTHTFSATTGNQSANHTHNVGRDFDGGSGSSRYSVHDTGSSGAGGQSPTSSQSASHTHAVSGTTSNGAFSNTGVNHMNPYVGVYLWHRTA